MVNLSNRDKAELRHCIIYHVWSCCNHPYDFINPYVDGLVFSRLLGELELFDVRLYKYFNRKEFYRNIYKEVLKDKLYSIYHRMSRKKDSDFSGKLDYWNYLISNH